MNTQRIDGPYSDNTRLDGVTFQHFTPGIVVTGGQNAASAMVHDPEGVAEKIREAYRNVGVDTTDRKRFDLSIWNDPFAHDTQTVDCDGVKPRFQ